MQYGASFPCGILLKLLINPKSMIFSLVLGFEDKKIKNIIYRSRQSFLLHSCAAIYCSINSEFQLLLYFQTSLMNS